MRGISNKHCLLTFFIGIIELTDIYCSVSVNPLPHRDAFKHFCKEADLNQATLVIAA